jgi:hypothetical protein
MWKIGVVLAAAAVSGCATAGPPLPHNDRPLKGAELQRKCNAYAEVIYQRYKAIGPVVAGPISLVATLADPDWRAKGARTSAHDRCIANSGVF